MKKIYLLALTTVVALGAQAQSLTTKPGDRYKMDANEVLNQRKHNAQNVSRQDWPFYMDHSTANYDDGFYVWRYNSLYTAADTGINFVGLSLNKVAGFTDPSDPSSSLVDSTTFGYATAYPSNIGIRVDTIFVQITHENNSGNYDYFNMQIVKLTGKAPASANGTPAMVYWEGKDSSNVSLSSGGNWLGNGAAVILSYTPQPDFMGAAPGTQIGVIFNYVDASKTDTLGVLAGYMKDPSDPNKAAKSEYRTSYMRYPPMIPNVTPNSNIGYGSPVGSSGWFEAQNWGIWAYVTVGTGVNGFNENSKNGFRILDSYPNPSSEVTQIRYQLGTTSNVSVVVTDIIGKVVYENQISNQQAGEHMLNLGTDQLKNGVYTYTFYANDASISKRFVVQH